MIFLEYYVGNRIGIGQGSWVIFIATSGLEPIILVARNTGTSQRV
jgi:hypothetical protein